MDQGRESSAERERVLNKPIPELTSDELGLLTREELRWALDYRAWFSRRAVSS